MQEEKKNELNALQINSYRYLGLLQDIILNVITGLTVGSCVLEESALYSYQLEQFTSAYGNFYTTHLILTILNQDTVLYLKYVHFLNQ